MQNAKGFLVTLQNYLLNLSHHSQEMTDYENAKIP